MGSTEILVSIFAAIGITYLLRDGMLWAIYKNKRPGVYLEIPLNRLSYEELCDLFRCCVDVRATFAGRSFIQGVTFVHVRGGEVSLNGACRLARIFGLAVRRRCRKRTRRPNAILPR